MRNKALPTNRRKRAVVSLGSILQRPVAKLPPCRWLEDQGAESALTDCCATSPSFIPRRIWRAFSKYRNMILFPLASGSGTCGVASAGTVRWRQRAYAGAATRDIGSIGGSSAVIANGSGYGMATSVRCVVVQRAASALFPSIIVGRASLRIATLLHYCLPPLPCSHPSLAHGPHHPARIAHRALEGATPGWCRAADARLRVSGESGAAAFCLTKWRWLCPVRTGGM